MRLIDQLANITINKDGSVNFTTKSSYEIYASVVDLLYAYYAHQFLFDTISHDNEAIRDELDAKYFSLKSMSTLPTDTERDFSADYEHFLLAG